MITFSTPYDPGNVVMVRIRFTSGGNEKKRPAVVLTGADYHCAREDAVVVALTSQLADHYYGDYVLSDWKVAGLPLPTKAKGVIQTIERNTIERTLGTLSKRDFAQLKECVRSILRLNTE